MRGKLIVIEGLDGCGKDTQSRELEKRLAIRGKKVRKIDFPDYADPSSTLVQMYLRGDFGSSPGCVNAYAASSFYAVDRYASYVRHWKADYESGAVIIANRYTTSNALHQMSKLPNEEWDGFLSWLYNYEYNLLGLPEPDMVVMLTMPPQVSRELLNKRYGGDQSRLDIHERDCEYLSRCHDCAQYAAQGKNWREINCARGGKLMPVDAIAEMIFSTLSDKGII